MFPNKAKSSFAVFAVLILLTAAAAAKTQVAKQAFGHTSEGTTVDLYSLKDGKLEVGIMT